MEKNQSLYQRFLEERSEILRHKWFESEKAGYDIGFEKALLDWVSKHRTQWIKENYKNISEKKDSHFS